MKLISSSIARFGGNGGGVPLLVLFVVLQALTFVSISLPFAQASLVINEVAYKGSGDDTCNGKDWIELFFYQNRDEASLSTSLDLTNYILHDDKGKDDENAKTFDSSTESNNSTLSSGDYLVLCKGVDFEFGIGGDDTVTLLDSKGNIVSSVALPGTGSDDETYVYISNNDGDDNEYRYTTTSTPGATNVYTKPASLEEKLKKQNDAGNRFFLVKDDEDKSEELPFSKVVDINVIMEADSLASINDHPTYEEWVPFTEVAVSNIENGGKDANVTAAFASSNGGGKIRTKGQSTLSITSCVGLPTVPFQIEFDTPFMGMEIVYLRNHFTDQSYMREHASHVLLKQFDMPYLRTRPIRLSINGEYVGFYIMMEAPTQGYVMQRSFGAFDPTQTALFKVKTMSDNCDFSDAELATAANRDAPNPYYFEHGDHRADVPNFSEDLEAGVLAIKCYVWFSGEMSKDRDDMIKGYLEYNQTCGLAMVEMGRVDRDYGPKSIENAMISFLDSKFYNVSVDDLANSVDADQWLKNFAVYAVMVNMDSPIGIINNWYLATTKGGANNDWKIVQYDHNNIISATGANFCGASCVPKMIYWPILQPTCSAVEGHAVVSRILNSKENVQKYLDFVQAFVNMLTTSNLLDDLRSYGNDIKEFIVNDPLNTLTMKEYEEYELGTGIDVYTDDYNLENSPFLKTLEARLEQVQAQLDAINAGNLPRDGDYRKGELCPDWRDDSSGEAIIPGSTVGESCAIEACKEAAPCYENNDSVCNSNGELVLEDCKAASPFCDSCFPYSRCGTGGDANMSSLFVESDECGPLLASCADASSCFDHQSGICAYDGKVFAEECQPALPFCKLCFPNSRCGGLVSVVIDAPTMSPVKNINDSTAVSPTSDPIDPPTNAPVKNVNATNEATVSSTSNAVPLHALFPCATAMLLAIFAWFLFA